MAGNEKEPALVRGAESACVLGRANRGDARGQREQLGEIPAVEGQVQDRLFLHHGTHLGGRSLDQLGTGSDFDGLRDRADLQCEVLHQRLVHLELHCRNGCLLEPFQLHGDLVEAGRHVENRVGAHTVADGFLGHPRGQIGDRNGCAGNHGARRIGHMPRNGGRAAALGEQGAAHDARQQGHRPERS